MNILTSGIRLMAAGATLALLGGKLSAARNIVMRQHEAEAARIQQSSGRNAAAL